MADADLDRFTTAQAPIYDAALAELCAGAKRGHWMWFVFPQIAGLGRSDMAVHYALRDLSEAAAYAAHPLLGGRLRETTAAMLNWGGRRSAEAILGGIDAVKFRSSMTLFEKAAADPAPFAAALDRFFDGLRDLRTLAVLERDGTNGGGID
jgi:uncharacterized protein (DUF1810 family)